MTIPDPATFIGQRCIIRLKNAPMVIRTILSIDTSGVKVAEESGGSHVYAFSEIDMVSLEPRRNK
ncbi:MAG: hypothetical protein LUE17_08570 [Planctomycetaceae bacterium]|nr:hypothetical protein [Planctomycetaceae bacterium]